MVYRFDPKGAHAFNIACIVISTVFMGLRLLARFQKRQELWWDDNFMVLAWATLIVYLGMEIKIIQIGAPGFTHGMKTLSHGQILQFMKLFYIQSPFLQATQTLAKISILCFYDRVFTAALVRMQVMITIIACIVWEVASLFVWLFQCTPVRKTWVQDAPGHCTDISGLLVFHETVNIAIELWMIVMPLTIIATLNLSIRTKVGLGFIFSLGVFAVAASALRLVFLYHNTKPYDIYTRAPIWTSLTLLVPIIAGNLLMLKPLFFVPSILHKWYSSRKSKSTSHGLAPSARGQARSYNKMGESASTEHVVQVVGGKNSSGALGSGRLKDKDPYSTETIDVEMLVLRGRGDSGDDRV